MLEVNLKLSNYYLVLFFFCFKVLMKTITERYENVDNGIFFRFVKNSVSFFSRKK